MTDIVNAYFKQFYPAEFDAEKWNYSTMLGGMRQYEDYTVWRYYTLRSQALGVIYDHET